MRLRNVATALGALGLIVTPIVAQAANSPAQRAGASVDSAEELASGGGVIIALLALAAVVGAVVIAVEDDNEPTSP